MGSQRIEYDWTTLIFTFLQDASWGSWIWDSCLLGEAGRLAIKERNILFLLVTTLAHMLCLKSTFPVWCFLFVENFRLVTVGFIRPSKSTIYDSASDDLRMTAVKSAALTQREATWRASHLDIPTWGQEWNLIHHHLWCHLYLVNL